LTAALSAISTADLRAMARECGVALLKSGLRFATAESCTGGLIASTCTAMECIARSMYSSGFFRRIATASSNDIPCGT